MTLKDKISKARELRDKAHPDWSARCKGLDNMERANKIWSEPYGWIGSFSGVYSEADADFAVFAQNNIGHLVDALEKCINTLNYLTQIGSETSTIVARNTLRDLGPSEELTKERGE